MISTIILIAVAVAAITFSLIKDRGRTVTSLVMAKGMFMGMVGEITAILALVALFLTLLPEGVIKALLGGPSVWLSSLYGALIGAITILPAFVAFPLAASLIQKGAHLVALAAFITTLTMVGLATLPIEIKYFGTRFALLRNGLSLVFALLIAWGVAICI